MTLSAGTRVGAFEILAAIGAGGMGEVYRARDLKLDRDVAIKVLPESVVDDPDRIARFRREARVLASLNHPHIAAIYGLEETAGTQFLILELVEGETLAQRLKAGPLPLDDALTVARQMADALEAAHEQGIIHRDLKPANIKVRPDGTVKVLDFGLAKVLEPTVATGGDGTASPTIISPAMTRMGVILGTAAYMSPEQARGRSADKRSDVWAFGCVLYEMLTGRQTFPNGETVSDTLVGILGREPDWMALPAGTPPSIRKLLEHCLRKDGHRRLRDIGDARIEIEEAGNQHAPSAVQQITPVPSRRREYALATLLTLFLVTTVSLALTVRALLTRVPETPAVRFEVAPPSGTTFVGGVHLSPDGRTIAFGAASDNRSMIWVRPLDSLNAQPLPATEGVVGDIFWSADSKYIAFNAEGKLNKVAATGGPSQALCNLPAGYTGGAWNADGVILLGATLGGGPLLKVPASGGEPAPATELDASRKETRHSFPSFLPDGRHFLYVAETGVSDWTASVGALNSNERRSLPGIASEMKYSSSGRVVFLRAGSLMAQPFNIDRLELAGEPVPITDLRFNPLARAEQYSVSMTGALAYRAGVGALDSQSTQLTWFDRRGKQLALLGPSGEYRRPSLSPDGHYVAFERGAPSDIWVMDIQKGVTSRLVSRPTGTAFPTWSPDSRSIVFADNVGMFERAVGVVGEEKLLLKIETPIGPTDWSRDARYILFNPLPPPYDLWALPLFGDRVPVRLTKTPWNENGARISPDGHWIAYQSAESPPGTQLYIQSFPEPGRKQQVSTNGAFIARWSRDGKELFYVSPDLTLMAVSVTTTGSSLEVGAATPLFKAPIDRTTLGNGRSYDVAADGRFLVNVSSSASTPSSSPITVILNWNEELKQRVSTKF